MLKLTFRVTLVSAMIALLAVAMVLQGTNAYNNGVYTVKDLSQQLLEQTALRIEREIEVRLSAANRQGSLTKRLITNGTFRVDDFPGLVSLWRVFLEQNSSQSDIFICLSNGEFVGITRVPGETFVLDSRYDPKTGKLVARRYKPDDYPSNPMPAPGSLADTRQRPWYRAALRTRHPTWTASYVFQGAGLSHDVHGISFATPFFDKAGEINAVMESSFELSSLCQFLMSVRVAQHGYAFIIGKHFDGSRTIVVHPNIDLIMRPRPDRPSEFVPLDEFGDPVARAYAQSLAQDPASQTGTSAPTPFEVDGVAYIGLHQHVARTLRFPGNWTICIVVPRADILGRVDQNFRFGLRLGGGIFLLVLLLGYFISAQVAKPLERLGKETVAIGEFHIEPQPVAHSFIVEVDRLAVSVEDMKTSLRSFQKYVPADLVRTLLQGNQEARLGGERRVLTVCFCDLIRRPSPRACRPKPSSSSCANTWARSVARSSIRVARSTSSSAMP
ncbi:MAG: hypothetical protein AB7K24_12840 [Gemmataceae bacterium]